MGRYPRQGAAHPPYRISTFFQRIRKVNTMKSTRWVTSLLAGALALAVPAMAIAQDARHKDKSKQGAPKSDQDIPSYTLTEAANKGLVAVDARGSGDGRLTVSVKNLTRRSLRVVLPPGIVAQSATGQMGGMMGGMGGGMGGGGMRSVPASTLSFADLKPHQTRSLPTRLVSLNPLDPQAGLSLPQQDEPMRLMGDVSQVSDDPRVQKAIRRLAAQKVPTSVSQLVMWRLTSGTDWADIARVAEWATPYELTLARDFVEHLDEVKDQDAETGSILFQIEGTDEAGKAMAAAVTQAFDGKIVLGLRAKIGVPARPEGPSVACRVRLQGLEALVQVATSDGAARNWVAYGKFSLKAKDADGKFDAARLADGVAEGVIGRLVKATMTRGPREKGKLVFLVRIDNASPLILSGLAIQGAGSKAGDPSRPLTSLGVPPRKYITLPAGEDVVRAMGLKQGIRVTALDLSGL